MNKIAAPVKKKLGRPPLPDEVPIPKYMRPKPFARRMGVNWRTMYGWINSGKIPHVKFSGVILIDVAKADMVIEGEFQPMPPRTRNRKMEAK
jgi:hypothetical protein